MTEQEAKRLEVGIKWNGKANNILDALQDAGFMTGDARFFNAVSELTRLQAENIQLKKELREICAAIDDPAIDLTLTAVECIKKLKAENEWQPIETAPKDNTVFLAWRKHATHPLMVRYESSYDWFANYDGEHVYDLTHWMPLPKPPAMAQGDK